MLNQHELSIIIIIRRSCYITIYQILTLHLYLTSNAESQNTHRRLHSRHGQPGFLGLWRQSLPSFTRPYVWLRQFPSLHHWWWGWKRTWGLASKHGFQVDFIHHSPGQSWNGFWDPKRAGFNAIGVSVLERLDLINEICPLSGLTYPYVGQKQEPIPGSLAPSTSYICVVVHTHLSAFRHRASFACVNSGQPGQAGHLPGKSGFLTLHSWCRAWKGPYSQNSYGPAV